MPHQKPSSDFPENNLAAIVQLFGGSEVDDDPVWEAQQVMYDAWEAEHPAEQIQLARKALEISTNCADAYNLLAELASDPDARLDWYRRGVDAGARALGEQAFVEDAGRFWGIIETRPYMRARLGYAMELQERGRVEDATDHYTELLRLNPNDNQGVREILAEALFDMRDDEALFDLLARYKEDRSPAMAYTWALAEFRRGGDCPEARGCLACARRGNEHVPAYLLGRKRAAPKPIVPGYTTVGGADEAYAYSQESKHRWKRTPGAIPWLRGIVEA